ncbi:hypothetical protein HMPREF1604_00686 [Escherichia coli 908519]|nr:hypothetical protein HMPREF1604_00686 [Escherichia coli 908519]
MHDDEILMQCHVTERYFVNDVCLFFTKYYIHSSLRQLFCIMP